jgi:chromosome segregation ATPase
MTAQVQDLLRQRDGAYGRAERLEQELDAVRRSLGEAAAAHEEERRALQAHVRAVEDRAHTEVDRHRQALRSAEQEWGRERMALATSLRESEQQAIAAANREQQALRRLEGVNARADGLEAQLTSLKETTRQVTEALRQGSEHGNASRQASHAAPRPEEWASRHKKPIAGNLRLEAIHSIKASFPERLEDVHAPPKFILDRAREHGATGPGNGRNQHAGGGTP